MNAFIYPLIAGSGALQAMGAALAGQLRKALVNPWLAAFVSFVPIVIVLTLVFFAQPTPLPTLASLGSVRWYDAFGGVAGSAAVLMGLLFIHKVGSGPLNGLTVTGNILMSLVLDSVGGFGLHAGGFRPLPWLGGLVMIAGVVAITLGNGPNEDDRDDGKGIGGKLLYPLILVAGALQAIGAVLNAELRRGVVNPWLAADISFISVAGLFLFLLILRPSPLPSPEQVGKMPWWTPLAGLVGAVAVFTGLLFIDQVGAGVYNGLLISANLVMAVVLDHFGWLGLKKTPTRPLRLIGVGVTIVGIVLISIAKGGR